MSDDELAFLARMRTAYDLREREARRRLVYNMVLASELLAGSIPRVAPDPSAPLDVRQFCTEAAFEFMKDDLELIDAMARSTYFLARGHEVPTKVRETGLRETYGAFTEQDRALIMTIACSYFQSACSSDDYRLEHQ